MEATTKKLPSRAAKIAFWSFFAVVLAWFTGAWIPVVNGIINVAYGGWCGTMERSVIESHNGATVAGQAKIIAIAEQKLLDSQDGNLSCSGIALMSNQEKHPIAFRLIEENGVKLVYSEFTQ